MAAEPGSAALTNVVLGGAAATAIASSNPDIIPMAAYGWATFFALLGIMARHFSAAGETGQFNLARLAFDIPTAPMLGITAYIACLRYNVDPTITPFTSMLSGFLGPSWIREIWGMVKGAIANRIIPQQKDNSP